MDCGSVKTCPSISLQESVRMPANASQETKATEIASKNIYHKVAELDPWVRKSRDIKACGDKPLQPHIPSSGSFLTGM